MELTDFTKEEMRRIDVIYGDELKSATDADIPLIAKWESYQAEQRVMESERVKAMRAESAARVADSKAVSDLARENLREQQEAAMRRYQEAE